MLEPKLKIEEEAPPKRFANEETGRLALADVKGNKGADFRRG